jgi:hypothetical protein
MPVSPPDFTPGELDEARRMNRQLRWAPRFRAPTPLGKLMIQTMLGAQGAFVSHGVRGVTTRTRQVQWKGHLVSLRILQPAGEVRGVYVDYHGGGWSIARELASVSLRDVYTALGSPELFAMSNRTDAPGCLVEQAVNAALNAAFHDAEALLLDRFGTVTLAQLSGDFHARLVASGVSLNLESHHAA